MSDGKQIAFSSEEISALKAVFSLFDEKGTGFIEESSLEAILEKVGRDADEVDAILEDISHVTGENYDGKLSFEDFIALLQRRPQSESGLTTGPDPKVIEFINILEEYRTKCEEDGNYLEAQRADRQLVALRKQEAKRQSKSLKARQIAERQDVQIAHNMQYTDFNQAWDQYMDEYDRMAQTYIKQMTEKHASDLRELQQKLHQEVMDRPPRFSKELIEWRRRQHMLARQKNYPEAQKIKKIADAIEEKERSQMNDDYKEVFARKETKFRQQQQGELQALLKRIDARRKEHIKQRNLDSKRLLQRNRNVQSVLESKQSVESIKKIANIKSSLTPKERAYRTNRDSIPPEARAVVKSKKTSRDSPEKETIGGRNFITSR